MPQSPSWILTHSGKRFSPLDPDPDDIVVADIAHALSMLCRFTGHCRLFYSVAQHSVLVSDMVEATASEWELDQLGLEHLRKVALLHDATEAYLCDIASPLKRADGFAAYRVAETRLWGAICERFNLPIMMPEAVLKADHRIVVNEAMALMPTLDGWSEVVGPAFTRAEFEQCGMLMDPFGNCWAPGKAKQLLSAEFAEYGIE